MELGPKQTAWVESLENNPERQMQGSLGQGTPDSYGACCLGEGLCVLKRLSGQELPFNDYGVLESNGGLWELDDEDAEALGLYDGCGQIGREIDTEYSSLADMNDSGVTWAEIASFIRSNPEAVFKESK